MAAFTGAGQCESGDPFANLGISLLAIFLALVLGTLSQAIVLYGAFQAMRGRPVNLAQVPRRCLNKSRRSPERACARLLT